MNTTKPRAQAREGRAAAVVKRSNLLKYSSIDDICVIE